MKDEKKEYYKGVKIGDTHFLYKDRKFLKELKTLLVDEWKIPEAAACIGIVCLALIE